MINLSEELVNVILQYLAKKPYNEVYQIINEIQKQAQENKEKSED